MTRTRAREHWSRRRALRAGAMLALLLACSGCRRAGSGELRDIVMTAAEPASPTEVVARVNGAPILASDVAEQMRGGESAEQALQSLVQLELLAQEAHRRGLGRHPSVTEEQHRAMARLLIQRRFRDGMGVADIPRELVAEAYRLNIGQYQHPELVQVAHLLVPMALNAPPELHAQARSVAERARSIAASGPLSEEEFKQLRGVLRKETGIRVRAESLRTAKRGNTVPEFADAAFALTRPGQISPVVQTKFGYHVIYLVNRSPEVHVALEQAEQEIRERILPQARTMALLRYLATLQKELGVSIDERRCKETLSRGAMR